MKKLLLFTIILALLATSSAHAVEFVRQKNVNTTVVFPLQYINGTMVAGATGLDSELTYINTETGSWENLTDTAGEATEVQSTGLYSLALNQSETNHTYAVVQVKTNMTNVSTQVLAFKFTVGDTHNMATTDDGGTINVTSGAIDTITTYTGNTVQTGDAYAKVSNASYGLAALNTTLTTANTTITTANTTIGTVNTTLTTANTTLTTANATINTVNTTLTTANTTVTNANNTLANASYGLSALNVTITGIKTKTDSLTFTTANQVDARVLTNSDKLNYTISATGIDSIWDEAQSGHTGAGSFGKYLDAQVSTIGGGSLTVADIWDYNLSGYSGAGKAGTYLKGAGGGSSPADIADAVWDETMAGHTTSRSYGKVFRDEIDGIRGLFK